MEEHMSREHEQKRPKINNKNKENKGNEIRLTDKKKTNLHKKK